MLQSGEIAHKGVDYYSQNKVAHALRHIYGSRVPSGYKLATVRPQNSKVLREEQVTPCAFLPIACTWDRIYFHLSFLWLVTDSFNLTLRCAVGETSDCLSTHKGVN